MINIAGRHPHCMTPLKKTDTAILQFMRRNARENLTTISRKTGIPVSTIFDRLRSQQQSLIHRFTALIDFEQLGYSVRLNIFIKPTPEHKDPLKKYLVQHPNINNVFRINNGFDFAAEGLFRSMKEAEEFLERLEGQFAILKTQSVHVIEDLAREKMLSAE
jgi:DNA-binding Lrp family transcriptional regulator